MISEAIVTGSGVAVGAGVGYDVAVGTGRSVLVGTEVTAGTGVAGGADVGVAVETCIYGLGWLLASGVGLLADMIVPKSRPNIPMSALDSRGIALCREELFLTVGQLYLGGR